jgi:hypothetical protein
VNLPCWCTQCRIIYRDIKFLFLNNLSAACSTRHLAHQRLKKRRAEIFGKDGSLGAG